MDKKRKISPSIKELYKNDTTPIETFIPKREESSSDKCLYQYLTSKQIYNLGEYMTYISNKNDRNSLFMHLYKRGLENVLYAFNESILDYIYSPKRKTDSKVQISSENFYENLKELPASNFVEDSPEMKSIAKSYGQYLTKLSQEYINKGCSVDDIKVVLDAENKKYRPIVEEKRKACESDEKTQLMRFARKIISQSIKFHHDEDSFNHDTPKHQHFNFPDKQI